MTFNRKIDELGRLVLPIDFRAQLGINVTDTVAITLSNGAIVIRPCTPRCKFCYSVSNINERFGICEACIEKIKNS